MLCPERRSAILDLSRMTAYRIFMLYERRGMEIPLSRNYPACIADDYWSPSLSTLERLLHPLRIEVKDFMMAFEEDGFSTFLGESEGFIGVVHDRKKLMALRQRMMAASTGRNDCRSELARRLGIPLKHVGNDFRRKGSSITIHKVFGYCEAAGISPGKLFASYYDRSLSELMQCPI